MGFSHHHQVPPRPPTMRFLAKLHDYERGDFTEYVRATSEASARIMLRNTHPQARIISVRMVSSR